jgi:ribonuclease/clavin/mitogillin
MLNIVNVGYHSTNYYAIDVKNGRLLIDCGWPGTMPQFAAAMRRKSVAPTEIKYIIATHFHPDHAGLVEEFKRLGARLVLLESQADALKPADPNIVSSFVKVSPHNNVLVKFADSREFLAGVGVSGEILSTPGHSPDSVTLVLDDGYAFTGDLPPRFMVAEADTITRSSWDRIYSHPIKQVLPAHGGDPLAERRSKR